MYFAKDKTDRIQHVLDIKQTERNKSIALASDMKKLTDQEKERILKAIRYSFLPQDILLKLSTCPQFLLAKEFVVQGIACKLGGA